MNLRYSTLDASYRHGESRHAMEVMRELGVTWAKAEPHPIADQWWFIGCESVPAKLPGFITMIERPHISYGDQSP